MHSGLTMAPIEASAPLAEVDPQPKKALSEEAPANEYEDAEKNYRPKSIKFWVIIVALYLALFLVALVSIHSRVIRQSEAY